MALTPVCEILARFLGKEDEIAITTRTLAFEKGDLGLHKPLHETHDAPETLLFDASHFVSLAHSVEELQRKSSIDPTRVYVIGRVLSASSGAATVITMRRRVWQR